MLLPVAWWCGPGYGVYRPPSLDEAVQPAVADARTGRHVIPGKDLTLTGRRLSWRQDLSPRQNALSEGAQGLSVGSAPG